MVFTLSYLLHSHGIGTAHVVGSLAIVAIPWAYKGGARCRAISSGHMAHLLRREWGLPSRLDCRDVRKLPLPHRANVEGLPYSNHTYIGISNHLLTLHYASHDRESHSIKPFDQIINLLGHLGFVKLDVPRSPQGTYLDDRYIER